MTTDNDATPNPDASTQDASPEGRVLEAYKAACLEGEKLDFATFCRERGVDPERLQEDVEAFHRLVGELDALGKGVRSEPFEPPSKVGPYTVVNELGRGGMGEVYLVRQEEPVRRLCALKLIKLGSDSREVLRRFAAEQETLALMTHSNIARVFDASVTEQGRPYFVMEYVDGMPLDRFCKRNELDLEARIGLFLSVCAGVAHAHQKGVIHRDLKPSNIIVTEEDGLPVPKIIDFGLARAMSEERTERTLFTREGQVIGTPEYMSPEQAGIGTLDVDTRTDVYALGAMLYELVTGELPIPADELRSALLPEMQRLIVERDPERPSARLLKRTTSGRATGPESSVFASREWRSRLRGDLDWIVLKAIEKDPERRYANVLDLMADLQRYLRHETVYASPPSRRRRLGKFLRRNRVTVGVAVLVLLALTGVGFAVLSELLRVGRREALRQSMLEDGVQKSKAFQLDAAAAAYQKLEQRAPGSTEAVQAELWSVGDYYRLGVPRAADARFAKWWERWRDWSGPLPEKAVPGYAAFSSCLEDEDGLTEETRAALHVLCRKVDPKGYQAAKELTNGWVLGYQSQGCAPAPGWGNLSLIHGANGERLLTWSAEKEPDPTEDGLRRRFLYFLPLRWTKPHNVMGRRGQQVWRPVLSFEPAEGKPGAAAVLGDRLRGGRVPIAYSFSVERKIDTAESDVPGRDVFVAYGELEIPSMTLHAHAKRKLAGLRSGSNVGSIRVWRPEPAADRAAQTFHAVLKRGSLLSHCRIRKSVEGQWAIDEPPSILGTLLHRSYCKSIEFGSFTAPGRSEMALQVGEWHSYSLYLLGLDPLGQDFRILSRQLIGANALLKSLPQIGRPDALIMSHFENWDGRASNVGVFGKYRGLGVRQGLMLMNFDGEDREFRVSIFRASVPSLGYEHRSMDLQGVVRGRRTESLVLLSSLRLSYLKPIGRMVGKRDHELRVLRLSESGRGLETVWAGSCQWLRAARLLQMDEDPELELVVWDAGPLEPFGIGRVRCFGVDGD